MADSLDPDQQRAVDHAVGSLLLTAGAGSGKTRVLVARYLKHLQDGVAVANLVAITFTEKAAREMRQRIREAVRQKIDSAKPGDAEYERWRNHEQRLETVAIDTIHGYCTRLLRQHAVAAKLDPAFEVLSEGFARALRDDVATAALRELLLQETPTAHDLHELIVLHGWSRIVEAVEGFLDSPDVAAWRAFLAKSPEQIASEWEATAKAFVPALAAATIDRSPAIAALRRVQPTTAEGRKVLQGVLEDLQRFRDDPASIDADALKAAAKVGHQSTGKKLYGEENYEAVKAGYEAIRELLADSGLRELAEAPENLASAAVVSQRIARVACHVEAAYAARKKVESKLDFHDLLVRTRDLLRENAAVRVAVHSQVKFLLLDELQDTDSVQMELVELILGERFRGGGLFAVGDAKQSIYRFRGADVGLFHRLRDSLPAESRLQLTKNYRSRPGILSFVYSLCREWFPGEAALESICKENGLSTVEFLWAVAGEEKPSVEVLRQLEAAALAVRIRELISGPTKRCEPGDIVLLFRALSNVSIYEEALRKAGIDYYLVGGGAFFAQQEVYDIVNALRAIENPFDGASLVGVLRSPFCSLSDDAITAICMDEPWTGLLGDLALVPPEEQEQARRARRMLASWRQIKDSLPAARLLQRMFADSAFDAALLFEPLGERKLANLWKIQEMAREFDRAGLRLAEFITHLEGQVRRQPREDQAATVPEEAAHVVRIMSIHQAKGLEFPVVIVPDLGAKVRDGDSLAASWHRTLGRS